MEDARKDAPVSPPERSSHRAFIHGNALYVWGGYRMVGGEDVILPSDEIWLCDLDSGTWVCHTACLGQDSDVVVFGGCSNLCVIMDTVVALRAPSQHHCSDILIFQTQPYSLSRLCEDFIGEHQQLFGHLLDSLPSKLRSRVDKRQAFFSTTKPVLKA